MLVGPALEEEGSGMRFVGQIAPYHHFLSLRLPKVSIHLMLPDVFAGVSAYMNVLHKQHLQSFFLFGLL